jgi:hypothetical protein
MDRRKSTLERIVRHCATEQFDFSTGGLIQTKKSNAGNNRLSIYVPPPRHLDLINCTAHVRSSQTINKDQRKAEQWRVDVRQEQQYGGLVSRNEVELYGGRCASLKKSVCTPVRGQIRPITS